MKVIMVMFDTLNRRFLPPYGCDWVYAPNFKRLAEKTVIFDNCYAGSLPCMPARRELHTGRYNFLHRSWGPIEPYDESMPEILKKKGIYTHLVSDHYHYWEDGGCTYHNRYNSWEIVRGHEGDFWKGEVKDPQIPVHLGNTREGSPNWRHDWVNRKYMQNEEDMHQTRTFKLGLEFIEKNFQEVNWFLQIETFDPHEPFFVPQKYIDLYEDKYVGPHFDWPDYSVVLETPEQVEHCRKLYAASISLCDTNLGKILDMMDEKDLWKDTMLIVNTDHGFFLGEKDWWGKMVPPCYNEISHLPFFVWDPRVGKKNERRKALVQTIDIAPTILEFFKVKRPNTMQGKVLKDTIDTDLAIREAALFGFHGGHVNITNGNYTYMRAPTNYLDSPLYEYTLMPTHMNNFFSINGFKLVELAEPFTFTKGCKTMKIQEPDIMSGISGVFGTMLFDLQKDPQQKEPLFDLNIEKQMITLLIDLMKASDAPIEQYKRFDIPFDGIVLKKHSRIGEVRDNIKGKIGNTEIIWKNKGKSMYYVFLGFIPDLMQGQFIKSLEKRIIKEQIREIDEDYLQQFMEKLVPKQYLTYINKFILTVKKKAI